ncbi:MAG TPA: transglycosylase domain-containing protein, partial [Pseudonocardia sp.]|nr:transglycosylase domain-containing protein [Pseudonocardia sp.]
DQPDLPRRRPRQPGPAEQAAPRRRSDLPVQAGSGRPPPGPEQTFTGRLVGNPEQTFTGRPAGNPEQTFTGRPVARPDQAPTGQRIGMPEPAGSGRPPGAPERTGQLRPGASDRAGGPRSEGDSPANATAARLLAEGRARMSGDGGERRDGRIGPSGDPDVPESGRRRGRARGAADWFEPPALRARAAELPAQLAVLPELTKQWCVHSWRRHRQRLASYTPVQRRWRRVRLAGLGAFGFFVVLPVMLFFVGYLCFSVPTPDDAVNKQVATINFADGSQLAKVVPQEGNRIKVSIDQIPKHVQYAVLAAEDRSFFSNPGFDPIGIARAAARQLTGGGGGGSTITQQYVKNSLVGDQHSLWRKYREMILAVKISQENTKADILADYLNAIYFGRGAYGIEAASQAYFGKNVWELNPSEGALLAGVIQSPSRWDPAVDPQHSVERWTFVADGMARQGWLTAEQRAAARFPVTIPPRKISGGVPTDDRGLILSAIRDELESRGISEQEFSQEGLKITTTIDPVAQQQAVDAAHKGLEGQPPNLRSALVSIDPQSGAIQAYYGGDNGVGLDYARVLKQPGSTFKPFVLLADLLQPTPMGLGTQFKGEPLPGLRNADGASCQVCDLKQAMTISNNVIFHELAVRVGPQKVADAAKLAGINTPMNKVDAGIALGDKEVTPVELASAYATIAAGGVYHPPHLVSKVTTSDDRVLYEAVNPSDQRFSAQVARNVIEAMLGVPTYDKLTLSSGRPVAAKTGTVQSYLENQNNDAWTAGFTPQLASVVWIGTDQNTPIKTSKGVPISGASLPGAIWKSYMFDATKPQSAQSFGPFKAIGAPPAVTGPYDGFAASNQAAAQPSVSTPPSDALPPDQEEPRPNNQRSNSGGGGGSSSHEECGLLTCKTVQDEGQRRSSNSESEQPEAQSPTDSDPTSTGLPAARQPVRG